MNREKYFAFLSDLQRKTYRRKQHMAIAGGLFFLIYFVLYIFVRYDLLGIGTESTPVISYLLHTPFYSFSPGKLRTLLLYTKGDDSPLWQLLGSYWGSHVAITLGSVGVGYALFKGKIGKYTRTVKQTGWIFFDTVNVRSALVSYMDDPKSSNRRRLLRALSSWLLGEAISPFGPDWKKSPEKQWFQTLHLPREAREIPIVAWRFPVAITQAVRHKQEIEGFLEPLAILEDFFWSVAKRTEPRLRKKGGQLQANESSEADLLRAFMRTARPLIISAFRTAHGAKGESRSSRIVTHIVSIASSSLVKGAITVAVIAAVVMCIGVLLFKVEVKQAFLTWFAVAFGSITLSVGITSVRLKKESKPENAL